MSSRQAVLILIPARYASTRFPGKPLAQIAGKSMIQRVVEGCEQAVELGSSLGITIDIAVVTDDSRIEAHLQERNLKVCRVDDDVPSGSERIWLAYQRFFQKDNYQLILNVQGDEPLIKGERLFELIQAHLKMDVEIMTIVRPRLGLTGDFLDPNKVKVVFVPKNQRCLYFSRASVPMNRDCPDDQKTTWYQHIGVYSYRPTALRDFCQMSLGTLEHLEKLEQLRALEMGMLIGAIESEDQLLGVDTPEDIVAVEGVLK